MTLRLTAIILALAIYIAIPLAILIAYVRREIQYRRLIGPVRKAMARDHHVPPRPLPPRAYFTEPSPEDSNVSMLTRKPERKPMAKQKG